MIENIENYNKDNENQNKKADKKKYTLAIDYSKFQKKFISNNNANDNTEKSHKDSNITNNVEKFLKFEEKIQIPPQPQKNFDQFLNISGILDESQSSLIIMDNQNNMNIKENELNPKIYNVIESNKINKNIFKDYLNNIPINDNEQNLLLSTNYKDLIKSNININKNYSMDNKKREKSFDEINSQNIKINPILKTSKKKNKYTKFLINKNNDVTKTEKKTGSKIFSCDKNSLTSKLNNKEKINSYTLMIKNTNKSSYNIKINKNRQNENNSKENNSFNLFNDVNHKNNISNFSEISYNALSTATGDVNEKPKNRNKRNNQSKNNLKNNKEDVVYSNSNRNNNLNSYNKNRTYEFNEDKNINKNKNLNNNNKNLILYTIDNKNNYENNTFKNNKFPSKTNNNEWHNHKSINKNEQVMNLLDNIRNQYQNKENKYINQQNSMKNEIKILKEKLKTLSVNEALYQVEIEKLKLNKKIPTNTNQNINTKKDILNNNQNIFGEKLDNIIQKYNKNKNNESINKNINLLEMFDLNKDILEGENILDENDDDNYEEVFNNYPKLKKFIQILAKKYKNEKEYRMRLEEKTIEIFMNDIKRINYLEKKVKKLENDKRFRVNSSLNYSYDNDLSEGNNSKDSCKSYDKSL